MLLGVNVDHIATIRQQRYTPYPDPVKSALLAERAGADLITMHLREDRRHIQGRDIELFMQQKQTILNLEMAITDEMLAYAIQVQPEHCCLVPEKRQELTTEGGLDVLQQFSIVENAVKQLIDAGIEVSLFIDPNTAQIDAAIDTGAKVIEIHTGKFAETSEPQNANELAIIDSAVQYAHSKGLIVNAGHGLHYENVSQIANIANLRELNIGHAIVAYALEVGIEAAVKKMQRLIQLYSGFHQD